MLSTDATAARDAAKQALGLYASLPNYRNTWLRLGFTEDEMTRVAPTASSTRSVAWGDADTVRAPCPPVPPPSRRRA